MAILNFTLGPEALSKLHDAIVCLGKFSEAVSIEASHDKLVLTALNTSKSAYASFTFVGNKFFSKYIYRPVGTSIRSRSQDKFNCKIYNKALLSVFKGRVVDPSRERDTAVEKCDVAVEDGEGKAKSRFVIKIVCRHGVIKTYRLTFESVAPMHALFVKESAHNKWAISSKALREFVEHFGPGTEQLDIYNEDSRASLTSFTEKITSGSEILKQPLHTTIAVDTLEFGEFAVEEKLHIVISVKDFKAIVAHAGITNVMVKALYSHPSSPMQISYGEEGISTEFILMTIGESRAASQTPAANAASRAASKRLVSKQPLESTPGSKRVASEMPPPPINVAPSLAREAAKARASEPHPPPPASDDPSSMFVPNDDDRRWDPAPFDDEEDEMLLWDDNMDNRNAVTMSSARQLQGSETRIQNINSIASFGNRDADPNPTQRLPPTQHISQIKGMFDD